MMPTSIDEHKFNDDLLLHDSDRKLAAGKYPSIYHVLDHPELRQLFSEYDEPANRAKRNDLRAGIWAIGLGFGAYPPIPFSDAHIPPAANPRIHER